MEIYWFIDVKYEESFAVMRLANIKKKIAHWYIWKVCLLIWHWFSASNCSQRPMCKFANFSFRMTSSFETHPKKPFFAIGNNKFEAALKSSHISHDYIKRKRTAQQRRKRSHKSLLTWLKVWELRIKIHKGHKKKVSLSI